MLKKFLITGGIAIGVWVVVIIVFALSSRWRFDFPEWIAISLYVAAFYLAPVAFIVAIIGSIVCIVKAGLAK